MRESLGRLSKSAMTGALGAFGVRLVRAETVIADFRKYECGPVESEYRARLRPFIIDVLVPQLRILPSMAFACVAAVGNPFVDTLIDIQKDGSQEFSKSRLEQYYQQWQPASAAEVLGVQSGTSAALDAASPLSFVMPWNSWSLDDAEKRWRGFISADNRQHGTKDDVQAGWKAWGPVSTEVGNQELRRLHAVYRSIQAKGYRRSDDDDGDIKGVVLLADLEHRVIVTAGHHRAAALAALGRPVAAIRIDNPVVRRSDVAVWPNVRSGLFTAPQALAIFDRHFEGRQPPTCRWRG